MLVHADVSPQERIPQGVEVPFCGLFTHTDVVSNEERRWEVEEEEVEERRWRR